MDISELEVNEGDIEVRVKEELAKVDGRRAAIRERVAKMKLIHEDLIVIEKIDVQSMQSFLSLDANTRFERIRTSYYGFVLATSMVDTLDALKETKKGLINVSDVVSFNPDSAYSLNVTVPDDMPEIWILSVENILLVDHGFDPVKAKENSVRVKFMIQTAKEVQVKREMQKAEKSLKINSGPPSSSR